jgi:YgiT-type zinc finger domain-containing protein
MNTLDELEARWHQLSDEVITGMKDWRVQHPRATFQEIEDALDTRLARLRARMLQDAALLSRASDLSTLPADERPLCAQCGARMVSRGQQSRTLTTNHEQAIELRRSYAVCPHCHTGFFPPR